MRLIAQKISHHKTYTEESQFHINLSSNQQNILDPSFKNRIEVNLISPTPDSNAWNEEQKGNRKIQETNQSHWWKGVWFNRRWERTGALRIRKTLDLEQSLGFGEQQERISEGCQWEQIYIESVALGQERRCSAFGNIKKKNGRILK